MKKKTKILFSVLGVIVVLAIAVHWAFFDLQRIKGETLLNEVSSPNGQYTVSAYLNNGGATTAFAVLCSVKDNRNGKEKNIYWCYREQDAKIEWIDDYTVIINGISLDVRKDTYDFRQDDEFFTEQVFPQE